MARKIVTYTVEKKNRDEGKSFVITEMSAVQGHEWATKALFAILNSGVEMPEEMANMGLAGLAVMGMGAVTSIPHAVAKPLLDELMTCVQIKMEKVTRAPVPEDYEEVITIFDLQREVLSMHIAPFISGVSPTSE
jgi:hypothetical protein